MASIVAKESLHESKQHHHQRHLSASIFVSAACSLNSSFHESKRNHKRNTSANVFMSTDSLNEYKRTHMGNVHQVRSHQRNTSSSILNSFVATITHTRHVSVSSGVSDSDNNDDFNGHYFTCCKCNACKHIKYKITKFCNKCKIYNCPVHDPHLHNEYCKECYQQCKRCNVMTYDGMIDNSTICNELHIPANVFICNTCIAWGKKNKETSDMIKCELCGIFGWEGEFDFRYIKKNDHYAVPKESDIIENMDKLIFRCPKCQINEFLDKSL